MMMAEVTKRVDASSTYRTKRCAQHFYIFVIKLLSVLVVGTTSALTAGVVASTTFGAPQIRVAAIVGGILGAIVIASCWEDRSRS